MPRALSALALALAATTALAQAPALDGNATVVTVNGEPIRTVDYVRRMEWFTPNPKSALGNLPVGFQVLRQMVSERMIMQLAKGKSVAPTEPEIDARVAEFYRNNPTLKATLAEAGRGEADVRAEAANEEAQFKLVTAGVTITDLEVEKRYRDLPSQFEEPQKFKLSVVAVGDDAATAKVDAALKAGRPFADVAKENSLDVRSRSAGGAYGEVAETALPETIRPAIAATSVGGTSAWVKTDQGARLKFLVEGVTPAKKLPLDATLRARIRRNMMLERGNQKNKVAQDLDAATLAGKVVFIQPRFQQLYDQILVQIRNQKAPQG